MLSHNRISRLVTEYIELEDTMRDLSIRIAIAFDMSQHCAMYSGTATGNPDIVVMPDDASDYDEDVALEHSHIADMCEMRREYERQEDRKSDVISELFQMQPNRWIRVNTSRRDVCVRVCKVEFIAGEVEMSLEVIKCDVLALFGIVG